jgi:hypothetical protein
VEFCGLGSIDFVRHVGRQRGFLKRQGQVKGALEQCRAPIGDLER